MNETTAADVDAADDATRGRDAAGADAADPDAVVVGEGVRKSYGDVVALDGVDIRVESGEVFGLIGPNGAGKTTLVRALTGGRPRPRATCGCSVSRRARSTRSGSGCSRSRSTRRSGSRRPNWSATTAGSTTRRARRRVRPAGRGDGRRRGRVVRDASGGQKRRTCVATAIVNDPDLLFLDEPTTGIDPAGRRSIHRLIERLAGGGTTVFLTSHAMDEVERLADRVALLRDGKIVAVGAPEELIADHGGEPRLEVKLDGPASEADCEAVQEAIREALSDESAGRARTRPRSSPPARASRIGGVRPEGIGDAVDALETAEIDFESLAWSEPSLEDVYLRLTGEEYSPRSEPLDEVAPDGGDR